MVQVIRRAAAIAGRTGLQKTTTSNILRTLVETGWLAKSSEGAYRVGPAVMDLARPAFIRTAVMAAAESHVRALAELTREAAVLTICDRGEMLMVAKEVCEQGVMANAGAFLKYAPYATATGRVLLAYMDHGARAAFVKHEGLPTDAWPGVATAAGLEMALARIRAEGILVKEKGDNDVQALAVPVFGPDRRAWAALGVFMPAMRFRGKHRTFVITSLHEAGERLGRMLSGPQVGKADGGLVEKSPLDAKLARGPKREGRKVVPRRQERSGSGARKPES
ncbi:MAG: IclR family transcriptional regulator C-terminal domain-containing protein [Planctomycetota bacterium]